MSKKQELIKQVDRDHEVIRNLSIISTIFGLGTVAFATTTVVANNKVKKLTEENLKLQDKVNKLTEELEEYDNIRIPTLIDANLSMQMNLLTEIDGIPTVPKIDDKKGQLALLSYMKYLLLYLETAKDVVTKIGNLIKNVQEDDDKEKVEKIKICITEYLRVIDILNFQKFCMFMDKSGNDDMTKVSIQEYFKSVPEFTELNDFLDKYSNTSISNKGNNEYGSLTETFDICSQIYTTANVKIRRIKEMCDAKVTLLKEKGYLD